MALRALTVEEEVFPLFNPFVISRLGARSDCRVITVTLREGKYRGRGECQAINHLDKSQPSPILAIKSIADELENGLSRADLQHRLSAGFARNAIDCALFEIEAKKQKQSAFALAGIASPRPLQTLYTLSMGSVEAMAQRAQENRHRPFLKLKLGADENMEEIIKTIRTVAPDSRLFLDANTAWSRDFLLSFWPVFLETGIALIEQPFPPGCDEWLEDIPGDIPIIADESCQDGSNLADLAKYYAGINIKLDKVGGLTAGLSLLERAKARGLKVMAGCNLGTSLAMAPAMILGQAADFIDLDGPLLLARDRMPSLEINNSVLSLPAPDLWGGAGHD